MMLANHSVAYTEFLEDLHGTTKSASPYSQANNTLVVGYNGNGLMYAEKEASAVAALLGTKPLLDKESTKSNVKDKIKEARNIHIATHTRVNVDNPFLTSLTLADGELDVNVFDMASLNMAVLSACYTGYSGNEFMSHRSVMHSAGTKRVISSLWEVDDLKTSSLMKSFYNSMNKGIAIPVALQKAKLEIQTEHNEADRIHPHFYAPFQLSVRSVAAFVE